jgi:hypothetical protein
MIHSFDVFGVNLKTSISPPLKHPRSWLQFSTWRRNAVLHTTWPRNQRRLRFFPLWRSSASLLQVCKQRACSRFGCFIFPIGSTRRSRPGRVCAAFHVFFKVSQGPGDSWKKSLPSNPAAIKNNQARSPRSRSVTSQFL